jgi:gamma-glutamyl-gamma-aminobutyrate hydrolase PuuD
MRLGVPTSTSKTQYYINQAYVDYVAEAGHDPVLITPNTNILIMADFCDGLILPGGIDIDPIFYYEDNFNSFQVDPVKDDFERQIFYAFANLGKPIFGICRGLQLIAREYLFKIKSANKRMEFLQHVNHHALASELTVERNIRTHGVSANLNVLYGQQHDRFQLMYVNSMHHQCLFVNELSATIKGQPTKKDPMVVAHLQILGLTRYGLTNKESGHIVEAFRINGWLASDILAVQWHPEELKDYALLNNFFSNVALAEQAE